MSLVLISNSFIESTILLYEFINQYVIENNEQDYKEPYNLRFPNDILNECNLLFGFFNFR